MKILLLPGDGIGPEITEATLSVLNQANHLFKLGLEWDRREIGLSTLKSQGTTLPEDVMQAARVAPGIILGPVDHLQYPDREKGGINPSGEFRVKLDLFANIRPAISRMGVGLTGKPIDLVIFRECTEGFYGDRNMFMGRGEFMPTPDVAIAVRKITARQCERISRVAFDWARTRRKKVTAVHKANVLQISDGYFFKKSAKSQKNIPMLSSMKKLWTPWRPCWFVILTNSTALSRLICLVTSCPTRPRKYLGVLAWLAQPWQVIMPAVLKLNMVLHQTYKDRIKPTPPPSFFLQPCSLTGSACVTNGQNFMKRLRPLIPRLTPQCKM